MESTLAWCAAGGLLSFLLKHDKLANMHLSAGPAVNDPDIGGVTTDDGFCVMYLNAIRLLPLRGVLRISASSLRALHVFKNQPHPRMMGAGRSKEGLSLYSRLNRTRSVAGARLLRTWMQAPPTSVSDIRDRQRVVKTKWCGVAYAGERNRAPASAATSSSTVGTKPSRKPRVRVDGSTR